MHEPSVRGLAERPEVFLFHSVPDGRPVLSGGASYTARRAKRPAIFLFCSVPDECPVLPSEWNGRKHFYAGALCCFADFYYFCPIYDRQIDS